MSRPSPPRKGLKRGSAMTAKLGMVGTTKARSPTAMRPMTNWTDRYHYTTPRQGFITVRLPDGSETEVEWSPLKQSWEDREGKAVSNWEVWRDVATD